MVSFCFWVGTVARVKKLCFFGWFHLLLVLRHTLWGVYVYCAAFPSSLCCSVIAPPVQGLILDGFWQQNGDQKVCQEKATLILRVG